MNIFFNLIIEAMCKQLIIPFFISSSTQGKIFYSICNDEVLDCKIETLFDFKQTVEDFQIIKDF